MAMKIQVTNFWVVMLCSHVVGYRKFLRTLLPHLLTLKVNYHITMWYHNPENHDLNQHHNL